MRTSILGISLAMIGCCNSSVLVTKEHGDVPWNTNYVVSLRPSLVTDSALHDYAVYAEMNYWKYCQVEGIVYPGLYSGVSLVRPDRYSGGADSALYTGFALAAFVYKDSLLGVSSSETDTTLKGIYWLTHAVGPGILCRAVAPLSLQDKWDYKNAWKSRIDSGFSGEAEAITSIWWLFPDCFYYTRTTRDQLTGLLFGLSVAWRNMTDLRTRNIVATIVQNIRTRLEADNWMIRDQFGRNDTSADKVDGLLRLQLEALYRQTVRLSDPSGIEEAERRYEELFNLDTWADTAAVLNNYKQYYAHNLRLTRILSIWTLETRRSYRQELAKYAIDHIWQYTKNHQNAWFAAAIYTMTYADDARKTAVDALRSLSLKPLRGWGSPYAEQDNSPSLLEVLRGCADNKVLLPQLRPPTNYFIWAKDPWSTGHLDKNGFLHESKLDFLLPYWLIYHTDSVRAKQENSLNTPKIR